MKIGVHFNCQNDGIASSLRALLPGAEVINYHSALDLSEAVQVERAAALNACDHVITSHFDARHGLLSAEALRRSARQCHVLPGFGFGGYQPDMCYVRGDGQTLASCTGEYHSRIAVAGYLAGLSAQDTVALYNRLVFSRLGYFAAYEAQVTLLCSLWAREGVEMEPKLRRWAAQGCFTYSLNHPKMIVLLDIACIACARMGVEPVQSTIDPASLPDRLGRGPMHPVFPEIAAALGIAPEGCFTAGTHDDRQVVFTPLEFVSDSFGRYAGFPADALRATAGVADAMEALGLSLRVKPPRRLEPAMVLMTHHGTLLRHGPSRGEVSHAGLAVADWEAAYLRLDGARLPARSVLAGIEGADVSLAAGTPRIVINRDGAFLCADPGGQAAFTRAAAADWEYFLPLREDEVALLRRLLAADWLDLDTHEIVPRQQIGIEAGPVLRFGHARIDLLRHFPVAEADGIRLIVDGAPVCVREHAPPAAPAMMVPEPGRMLGLVGPPVFVRPPVVADAADLQWMRRSAVAALALDGAPQATQALLRRVADPGGGRPDDLAVRFCGPAAESVAGWADAAVRLHALDAVAPKDAVFLLPAEIGEETLQAWRALGFGQRRFQRAGAGAWADVLLLDNASIAELPEAALAGCRARAGERGGMRRRLFWQVGIGGELGAALTSQGFETVDAALLTAVGGVAEAAGAGWIIGRTGQMPLVFCQAGTCVIELCDEAGFVQDEWVLSSKLGLRHAILPCAEVDGVLVADGDKLARLLAMML